MAKKKVIKLPKLKYAKGGNILPPPDEATYQDSLEVYNNAVQQKNYYDTLKALTEEPTYKKWIEDKRIMSSVKENLDYNAHIDLKNTKKNKDKPDLPYAFTDEEMQKMKNALERDIYYIKDMVTGAIDPNAPLSIYNPKIKPQSKITYEPKGSKEIDNHHKKHPKTKTEWDKWEKDLNILFDNLSDVPGAVVTIPYYSPLANKPAKHLTDSEVKERVKLFGTAGISESRLKALEIKPNTKRSFNGEVLKQEKVLSMESNILDPIIDYSVFPEQQPIFDYKTAQNISKSNEKIISYSAQPRMIKDPTTGRLINNPNRNPEAITTTGDKVKMNYGGLIPTNMKKTKKLYPLGGFINSGVTNIAENLGVNPKAAQIIGSGVATATGFIPGMQDNLFQAGDLTGDIMKTSNNKKVANVGQTVSAMAPLLNMIDISSGAANTAIKTAGNVMGNAFAMGGEITDNIYGTNIPNVFKDVANPPVLNANNGLINTPEDKAKAEKAGYKMDNLLLYHQDPNNLKSVTMDPYMNAAQLEAAQNKVIQKLYTPSGVTPVKKAMGGALTEFEGNSHEEGGIPLGNSNNEVEGGEAASKQYVYSDKIKLPWNKKATFADESKRIAKKYKGKEEDALAKKSMQIELDKLRDMQETAKSDMMTKAQKLMIAAGQPQQMAYGGKIKYAGGGLPIVPTSIWSAVYPGMSENSNSEFTTVENNSKSYTPEEELQIQELQKQYALNQSDYSQGINKQQYDEALAQLGNNDGFNASHVNPAYANQFNQQLNPNNNISTDAGTRMGQQGAGMGTTANDSSNNNFNDELTTGQKLAPYLPVLGQAATLIGGATKTQYQQMTPEYIDLKAQRTNAQKQAAIARLASTQNARNIGGNSGRAYSNMVVSNSAIASNLGDQLGQSYMNEANTNAQISNQADQFNTQIKNEQVNANEMNKSKWQEQMIATLANASGAYMGVGKDQRAYASNNRYNEIMGQNLGTEDYIIGYDANGLPITKFNPKYK